jgi:radical SAM protein with 4Fe4S-binding SPASM domain
LRNLLKHLVRKLRKTPEKFRVPPELAYLSRNWEECLKGIKRQKPVMGPFEVDIHITNACQLDCIGCWHYSPLLVEPKPIAWKSKHLTQPVFESLVNDLSELGTRSLNFSGGGDPLAHPKVYDFIEYATAHGLKVKMVSNLLLARDPERLAKSGLRYVLANFSAGSPAVYKAYHSNQPEESYDKLLEIVRILVAGGISIDLNCVLSSVNYLDIENMIRVAADTTKTISFKTLTSTKDIGTESVKLTPEQVQDIKNRIPDYTALADSLGVKHTFKGLETWLSLDELGKRHLPVDSSSCYTGYYATSIRATGNVTLCCDSAEDNTPEYPDVVLGNLNESRFKEIWFSKIYQDTRNKLEKRQYWDFCSSCSFFAQNQSLTGQLQPK